MKDTECVCVCVCYLSSSFFLRHKMAIFSLSLLGFSNIQLDWPWYRIISFFLPGPHPPPSQIWMFGKMSGQNKFAYRWCIYIIESVAVFFQISTQQRERTEEELNVCVAFLNHVCARACACDSLMNTNVNLILTNGQTKKKITSSMNSKAIKCCKQTKIERVK